MIRFHSFSQSGLFTKTYQKLTIDLAIQARHLLSQVLRHRHYFFSSIIIVSPFDVYIIGDVKLISSIILSKLLLVITPVNRNALTFSLLNTTWILYIRFNNTAISLKASSLKANSLFRHRQALYASFSVDFSVAPCFSSK